MNVILLTIDALRSDHMSCYGYERETTPEIDAFAAENLRARNCCSASSHTREAVAPILTGQYPDECVSNHYTFTGETIATQLKEYGYRTAAFHSNPYISRAYGYDVGFDEFDDDIHLSGNRILTLLQRLWDKFRNHHYARASKINDRSLRWLDEQDKRPVFLWNHYMDVHGPYEPLKGYDHWDSGLARGREAQRQYRRALKQGSDVGGEERQALEDAYDGEIRYIDEKIGEFLESLSERGFLANSLIIITADHGDGFGEHGYFGHPRQLHDELVRVPLIVKTPDGTEAEVQVPASTLDVVPTVLAAIDEEDTTLPGTPIQELATRSPADEERTVFSAVSTEGDENEVWRFAARSGDGSAFAEVERGQTDGTVERSAGAAVSEDLREFLQERLSALEGDSGRSKEQSPDTDAVENRLEALGYK